MKLERLKGFDYIIGMGMRKAILVVPSIMAFLIQIVSYH